MAHSRICSVDDCGKKAFARELCRYHYEQDRVRSAAPCSVSGCSRQASRRGMCTAHYKRWARHGDPLAGRTERGALALFFEKALSYSGDECLIWPFGHTDRGYAVMWHDGHHYLVHRRICEEVNGPPPTPDHEAAHSCGKGHKGCIAPGHLSWKTTIENEADKLIHGTIIRGEAVRAAKLTEADVRAIRASTGTISAEAEAHRYNVSPFTIYRVRSGARWGWLE